MGAIRSKECILGKFCSFRGVHGRGDVSLPQFIDGVVCMGSYRRGDTLRDIAHHRLQNTNGLHPFRSSPFVICSGHGHRTRHQDAIRLFGLLGGRCGILTGILGARQIHVGQAPESITKLSGRYRLQTTLTSMARILRVIDTRRILQGVEQCQR
jgi:hypothetical protein